MQRKQQLEEFISIYNKSEGDVLATIRRNDEIELRYLIKNHIKYDLKSALEEAAENESWGCFAILAMSDPHLAYPGYGSLASSAFLSACRDNDQALIEKFVSIFGCGYRMSSYMFFEDVWHIFPPIQTDPENGYTALHWLVAHNNALLLTIFSSSEAPEAVLHAKDHSGRTALELALMLGNMNFAQQIAGRMNFSILVNECNDDILKMIMSEHLTFPDIKYCKVKENIKSKMIELIEQLDDKDKIKALNKALGFEGDNQLRYLLLNKDKGGHIQAMLAKMLLDIMNKRERKSDGNSLTSTTKISCVLQDQDVPLLVNQPLLEPVYIPYEKLSDYLNTRSFRAIFPNVPDADSPVLLEEKEEKKRAMLG